MLEVNNFLNPEPEKKNWKARLSEPKIIILMVIGIIVVAALVVMMILMISKNRGSSSVDGQKQNGNNVAQDDKKSDAKDNSTTTSADFFQDKNKLYEKLSDSDKTEVNKIAKVFSPKGNESKTRQGEAVETLYYLKHNYFNLSKDAQEVIKPYLLRPNDTDSYLNAIYSSEVEDGGLSFIETAYAEEEKRPAYNKYIITADDKIKIWYPEITVKSGGTTKKVNLYEAEAKKVVAVYNESSAYAKFKKLLGLDAPSDGVLGGDKRIDVYLVDKYNKLLKVGAGLNADGAVVSDVAYSKGKGSQPSSYIVINAELSDVDFKSTAVHELFHIFQDNYEGDSLFEYSADKDAWWMEATAKWSEDYIYPNLGTEQSNLLDFIKKPEIALTKYDHDHEYGAYILVQYLVQNFSQKIIKDIFDNSISGIGALKSIEKEVSGLKGFLDDFWLWNYNKGAAKQYSDPGGLISFSTEESSSFKQLYTNGDALASLSVDSISPLSSRVAKTFISSKTPKGKKIEKVRVDYSDFVNKSTNAGVQALIYTRDNKSYLEDWNGKTYREFNFKSGGKEDAMVVVLILANVDPKSSISKSNIVVTSIEEKEEEKKEEEKPLSTYYIDGIYTKTELNNEIPIYITTVSKGKMVGAQNATYGYVGKWSVDIDYKSEHKGVCTQRLSGCKATYTFDLNAAYQNILNGSDGDFIVTRTSNSDYASPAAETCCGLGETKICENYETGACEYADMNYGELYDMKENTAKLRLSDSAYFEGNNIAFDVIIKKK